MSLENNTILVTGCSRGLGLEITKVLLEKGASVIGLSRNINQDIENLQISYINNFIHHYGFDFEDSFNIKSINQILNKPIHGFVNNAAIAYDDIITNANYEKLNEMYHVNVLSPILLTKYIIRNMILHKTKGSIVHISSISAHTGYKGLSMYASTKGAIESFSKGTAREWGGKGIRSNCVVPGFMETDMSQGLTSEQKDKIYSRTSLKKVTDKTSVANTVKFLLSEESKSITGQNIFVDSGTI